MMTRIFLKILESVHGNLNSESGYKAVRLGLSSQSSGFSPTAVHMGFVAGSRSSGQVLSVTR
jgi:hypothetical protein